MPADEGPTEFEVFISCRANEGVEQAKAIKRRLALRGVSAFVHALDGGKRGRKAVARAMRTCTMAVILGTKTYSRETGSLFSSFQELRFILEKQKPFFLIKMCDEFVEPLVSHQLPTGHPFFPWIPKSDDDTDLPPGLIDQIVGKLNDVRKARGEHPIGRREQLMAKVSAALESGASDHFGRGKLMLVGQGRAGKTTTLRSLLAKPFEPNQLSTVGAATSDMAVTVDTQDVRSWQETKGGESEMARALRSAAMAKDEEEDAAKKDGAHKNEFHSPTEEKKKRKQQLKAKQQHAAHRSEAFSEGEDGEGGARINKGDSGDGDTADAAAAASELEKAVTDLNLDANIGDIEDDGFRVTFKIFDLGGQPTFYIFHPFFLTKYAVYVVVFSMADVTSSDELIREETWDFIDHWLGSIFLYARGAPVFMVGTFGDMVTQRKQHERISQQVFERFNAHAAFPQLIFNQDSQLWFWPVDNTKSIKDPQIAHLQKQISAEASRQDYVRMRVPLSFMGLYDKLMNLHREEDKPVVRLAEVNALAKKFGLTRDTTLDCLRFWHEYSMLLYYDSVPGMEDAVILSPQWAVDVMCKVIRNFDLHTVLQDREARRFNREWQELTRRGILHRPVLQLLWANVAKDLVGPFLDLMMRFGLCVTYREPTRSAGMTAGLAKDDGQLTDAELHPTQRNTQEDTASGPGGGSSSTADGVQETAYLVPAILPLTLDGSKLPSTTLSSFAGTQLNRYNYHETNAVFISFFLDDFASSDPAVLVNDLTRGSFLPEGLFSRVVAHLVGSSQFTMVTKPRLSRTQADVFFHDCKVQLRLVPEVGGIKVLIEAAQPRPLLRMVQDTIVQAVKHHYDELRCYTLVPYSAQALLFLEDVIEYHRQRHSLWVDGQQVDPAELEQRYSVWLPTTGLRTYYDTFLSYRQGANSSFVVNLHVAMEENQLISFLDANNLETGLNFKMAFMEAISRSLVACPVVSAGAIERLFQMHHGDYCDNVLLEWSCMLSLLEHVQQLQAQGDADAPSKHTPPMFLRRVAPLMLSRAWHNADLHSNQMFADTFHDLRALCHSLPDTVSEETARPLEEFFTERLHLPAPKRRTVREIVWQLLDMDAIFCWESVDAGASRTHQMVERTAITETRKWVRLREYANDVRQVVLRAKQLAREDAVLQAAVDAGVERSGTHLLASSTGQHASEHTKPQDQLTGASKEDGVVQGNRVLQQQQQQQQQREVSEDLPPVPADKPTKEWTEDEVAAWLVQEKFESLLAVFKREHVDGQLLLSITDDMLAQDLGVEKRLQRVRFFQRRAALEEQGAETKSSADTAPQGGQDRGRSGRRRRPSSRSSRRGRACTIS